MPSLTRHLFCLVPLLFLLTAPAAESKIRIDIAGVEGELLSQAKASVSASNYKDRDNLGALLVRQLFERGRDQLQVALQPLGYYQSEVEAELNTDAEGHWLFQYRISPGPRSQWRDVEVGLSEESPADRALEGLFSDTALQPDNDVDHRHYDDLKTAVQTAAAERGYFDGRWKSNQIAVRPAQDGRVPVDATLLFDSGQRYRFGETVWPELPFSSRHIQRYSTIQAGDPFSAGALRQLQYRLLDSGYFSDVDIVPNVNSKQSLDVPIELQLELRPRNRYSGGVGVGTDTGVRGTAAWEARWINRRGHRAGVELQVSEVAQSLAARYEIPIRDPATDSLRLTLDSKRTEQPDSESLLNRAAIEWRINRKAWTWRSFVRLENELSTISGADRSTNLLIPGIGAERTRSDAKLRPSKGYRLNLQLLGAHKDLGSDSSFSQFSGRVAALRSVAKRWRLKVRAEAGVTWVGEFDQLPVSQRFFAGGDSSVRGFSYQSLSPVDANGEQVGGQYLLAASGELEWRFLSNYGLALFYDTGNAFDDELELRRAAGLGFRWQLPVGALRIDVATPIDQDDYEPRLHISLGPDL